MEFQLDHPCLNFLTSPLPFYVRSDPVTKDITCIATKRIEPGEILFSLPYDHIITFQRTQNTEISKTIQYIANQLQIYIHRELLLWINCIVWLKYDALSPDEYEIFRIYLRALNEIPPDLASWPKELQNQCSGTTVFSTLNKAKKSNEVAGCISIIDESLEILDQMRQFTIQNYEKLQNLNFCLQSLTLLASNPNESIFNEKTLSWARGHYLSRRFRDPIALQDDLQVPSDLMGYGKNLGTLLPVIDLFNHSTSLSSCIIQFIEMDGRGFIQIRAGEIPLEIGDEITYNYGNLSNEQLIYAYGFCFPDNEHDVFSFSGRTSVNSFTFEIKRGGMDGVPAELWKFISGDDNDNDDVVEIGIEEIEMLQLFVSSKLNALRDIVIESTTNREHILKLSYIKMYIDGQIKILQQLEGDLLREIPF